MEVLVGDVLLGWVVDLLGWLIDGLGDIKIDKICLIECKVLGVMECKFVF